MVVGRFEDAHRLLFLQIAARINVRSSSHPGSACGRLASVKIANVPFAPPGIRQSSLVMGLKFERSIARSVERELYDVRQQHRSTNLVAPCKAGGIVLLHPTSYAHPVTLSVITVYVIAVIWAVVVKVNREN